MSQATAQNITDLRPAPRLALPGDAEAGIHAAVALADALVSLTSHADLDIEHNTLSHLCILLLTRLESLKAEVLS